MTTGLSLPSKQAGEAGEGAGTSSANQAPPGGATWLLGPHGILVVVAALYAVACAAFVPLDISLSWDEIVYSSQLGVDQVPMFWGGHRAWGSVLLIAPVVVLTKSVVAVRAYLVVLAGLAMLAAFWPWVSVFQRATWTRYTAPLAAGIFGTTWFAVYYGSKAYPNLWLAFALVCGVGYFVRAARQPTVANLFGAFAAFAVAALFRPTDALAAAAPIVLTLFIARRHAPRAVGAVLAGIAAGTGPWIVEAFQRFGGPVERLRSGAESADPGLRLRFLDHLAASDGPYLLCNPGLCRGVTIGMAVWWVGQPLVAIVAVLVARRRPAFPPLLLVIACAVFFVAPYLTFVGGSHPRFLIPAYALLSIAAAYALLSLLPRIGEVRGHQLAVAMLAAVMLAQAAVHGETLVRVVNIQVRASDEVRVRATTLAEQGGLVAPCLLYGQYTVGLSYYPGCDRVQTDLPPAPSNKVIKRALAEGQRVVLIYRGNVQVPEPYASWQRLRLQENRDYYAYLSPQ